MKKFFKFLIVLSLLLFCGVFGFGMYCNNVISDIDKSVLNNLNLSISPAQTTIFDDMDNKINERTANRSRVIKLDELQNETKNAFIAIEDHIFYKHHGINTKRVIKAGFKNIKSGYSKEGASTITQQLVKNTFLSNEKTFKRKIQEAYLATQIESKFSKNEILETYLNTIYFGNGAYGIESAANAFFSKSAKDLTLDESALLAGIIKSPKNLSPIYHPESSIKRRNLVLKQMNHLGFISISECEQAINKPLKLEISNKQNNDLYINYVMSEAGNLLNLNEKDIASKGLKIYTYLDSTATTKIAPSFDKLIKNESANKDIEGCLVGIDNTSMGVKFLISNRQTELKKRQPASLIKPLLCYAPAFDLDILNPATPILDDDTSFSGYNPKNADGKFLGWISTREALIQSRNIPAIKALIYVGMEKAKEYATKSGINFNKKDNHLAIALGSLQEGTTSLEIANAYCTFSNDGKFEKCHFIKRIEDSLGNVIYNAQHNKNDVFKPETCYMINDILHQTSTLGTAKRLSKFKNIFVKTGTNGTQNSNENLDAWCVAYNPEITICGWAGNTSGDEKNNLKSNQNGSSIGAKICGLALENIDLDDSKVYKKPNGIVEKNVTTLMQNGQQVLFIDEANLQKNLTKNDIFSVKYAHKLHNIDSATEKSIILSCEKINEKFHFSFNSIKGKTYFLYKKMGNIKSKVDTIIGKFPITTYILKKPENEAEYFIETNDSNSTILSNTIKIYTNDLQIKKEPQNIKSWFFN